MFTISEQIGSVVAADAQSSVSSLHSAVVAQARMCATVVEASDAAHLPVKAIQKTLDALSTGIRDLVSSRAVLVDAIRELAAIQASSNLQETSFGCPTGPYLKLDKNNVGAVDKRPLSA